MDIVANLKSSLGVANRFLNQPVVKENVKKASSFFSFAFGVIEVCDICQILRGRAISTTIDSGAPQWV